jgi:hypothetical protein
VAAAAAQAAAVRPRAGCRRPSPRRCQGAAPAGPDGGDRRGSPPRADRAPVAVHDGGEWGCTRSQVCGLVKTLGHERTHVWQVKTYGYPTKAERERFEAAARATEAQWREYYQMSKRP